MSYIQCIFILQILPNVKEISLHEVDHHIGNCPNRNSIHYLDETRYISYHTHLLGNFLEIEGMKWK